MERLWETSDTGQCPTDDSLDMSHSDVVALASGGLDSTVMLYALSQRAFRVHPLFVDYGQRAAKPEVKALRKVLPDATTDTLLTCAIPEFSRVATGGLVEPEESGYWVPHRNLFLLTVAGMVARKRGNAILLAIGTIGEASVPVPDADRAFLRKTEELLSISAARRCRIIAPLGTLSKEQVVRVGIDLGVPLKDTYSCYTGHPSGCGKCPACQDREAAFSLAEANTHDSSK